MAYNASDFDATVETLGQKYSQPEDLGRTIKIILTKSDFQFADQTTAETQTNWQTAINEENIFVLPYIYENEDMSEESVMQDFAGGDSLKVRDGSYAEKGKLHLSVSDMRKLGTYKNKTWRMFKVDENGNIEGTSPDNTVFKGKELTTFEVEKMNLTVGDVKRMVGIYYKEREVSEWTEKGVALRPLKLTTDAWDPRDLDGLTDVELTVVSSSATKIVVSAEAYLKGVALSGFDQITDWVVKNTSGVSQSITVTDNNDGTYDLDGTGFATDFTVNLGEPEDLSQDGYKSTGAKTITVA